MTSDHPVRRLLQRLCSDDTMARVVDPTLADIRWERGRPGWIGYLTLLKALTVHTVTSAPTAVGRVYADDDHAVPKAAAYAVAGAIVVAALLVAGPFMSTSQRGLLKVEHGGVAVDTGSPTAPVPLAQAFAMVLLVVTGALVVTLPAALLVAIPLALKRHQPSARLARRIIALSICCAAITYAMLVWVTPVANQVYRKLADGKVITPGRGGQGLIGLKREIERLRTFHGSETIVRQMQYEYEVGLALTASAVPLGLAGLAFAFSRVGRSRPLLVGIAALALYLVAVFPANALVVEFVLRRTSLPATPLAWLPNAVLVFIAGVVFAIRRSPQPQSPPASRPRVFLSA
jgi:hypothetical protein